MKVKDFAFYSVAVPSVLVFMLLPVLTTVGFVLVMSDFDIASMISETIQQFVNAV